jgi:hypothetical protein
VSDRPYPTIPAAALWRRADLPDKDSFALDLDLDRLAALEDVARRLAAQGREVVSIRAAEVPLGPVESLIDELRSELVDGRGFSLLRGFPVDRLSQAELEIVFWGVGLRLGRPVSQSVMGDRLGHVIDVTAEDPHARAYRNPSELTPHTDPADMLSFLCIRPARRGGVSRFVSSLTIHEEIRRQRPDLLEILYRGFRYHRLGEQGPDDPPITPHRIPVFSEKDGLVSCRYVRHYIEVAADEDPDIEITPDEREALEYFEAQAARPDLHTEFTLAPGEAIFANNFTVMHARTGFEDHSDPERKRHLLRLWLAADPPRPLVPEILHYEGEPGIPPQAGRRPSYATEREIQ